MPPDQRPLVSVLVNNYNYARFLGAAIESALAQSYRPLEVVVVDDGSTDGSRAVIAGFGAAVRPVLQANGGQASAFNSGVAASSGDIVCFLDADDVFLPHKVERVVEQLARHPDAGWLSHPLQPVDGALRPLPVAGAPGSSGRRDVRASIARGRLDDRLGYEGTATSGLCYRRELLERIFPIPEDRLLIDDYMKFAGLALAPGYVLDERLAQQRLHGANAMTRRPERACAHLATLVASAHWWRRRVPELASFADRIFAMAAGSRDALGCREPALDATIAGYVDWSEPRRMANITLRRVYHRCRVAARRRAAAP